MILIEKVGERLCSSPLGYSFILVHVMNTELQDQAQSEVHDQAQDPLPQELRDYPSSEFTLG